MIVIQHRRNTSEALKATPIALGIEVDIRSSGTDLMIHHDPFVQGELFEKWLINYKHKFLILNVKEEGLEEQLIELMIKFKIEDYFFLDQSFPFLIRISKSGNRRCAVRISEYESVETALSVGHLIDWVWIDTFTKFPLTKEHADQIKALSLKLCIVSPELHGRHDISALNELKKQLQEHSIVVDAVCTKVPALWS